MIFCSDRSNLTVELDGMRLGVLVEGGVGFEASLWGRKVSPPGLYIVPGLTPCTRSQPGISSSPFTAISSPRWISTKWFD